MAVQTPFFGKREPPSPVLARNRTDAPGTFPPSSAPSPLSPSSSSATAGSLGQPLHVGNELAPGATSTTPAVALDTPSGGPTTGSEGGSKLTVGPNIKLKGVEITDCDTLVVEGLVEATMDSRVIQIAEQGAFRGSADIDIAEIRGEFDGTLTVRQKLVIFSTGKVTGKIRYGKLVVEEGGQLSGEIEVGTSTAAKQAPARTAAAVA